MNALERVGDYTLLMWRSFSKPDSWKMFFKQLLRELEKQGLNSIPIVVIISVFIGAVICIQMRINTASPFLPSELTGYATRETMILEFSSAILCLILAGKVGSNIASEIGTMRITEQIDALEIMGVNSANYLILPKIIAFMAVIPCLVTFSICSGLLGGMGVAYMTDMITPKEFELGIQYTFLPFSVQYTIEKSIVFAFIVSSISSYYGYTVKGGAREVGKASTNAVVNSSVLVLLFDVMLTKLLLS
ncbi:MAG: ABC transporter permease [Paludibacteraceae bacterium]|nr:ABC transporter permease [Paludibacteraceae bacterium]